MHVNRFRVENYKSLRNVNLENLGGLTVLIGPNGAGKSNILEALYRCFAEIDLTGVPAGLDSFAWFDGDTERTVLMEVEIDLSEDEWRSILPKELFDTLASKKEGKLPTLTINRTISKAPTGWQTTDVTVGSFHLLSKGKTAGAKELMQALGKPELALYQLTAPGARALDPTPEPTKPPAQPAESAAEIQPGTYVLEKGTKKVFRAGAFGKELQRLGLLPQETKSVELAAAELKAAGYQFVGKEFSESDLASMIPITTEKCQETLSVAYTFLKNKIKLILPVRDTWPQNPLSRATLLDQETHNQLKALSTSEARSDQKRWTEIRQLFSEASASPLETHPSYLCVNDIDFRIPLQHLGGGHQEYLILLRYITEDYPVLAIEEPEIHQHPALVRILFDVLRRYSAKRQIILTTHSTIFVDNADLTSTWIVTRRDKVTRAGRVSAPDQLRGLLDELGARPSDLFFANAVLFVEGESDRIFLERCGELLGLNFLGQRIYTRAIHGKDQGDYHLDVWVSAVQAAQTQTFMVLDQGAGASCKKHVDSGFLKPNRNLFFLKKGEIEDYYPLEALVDSCASVLGIGSPEELRQSFDSGGRVEKIEHSLKSKGKSPHGWKLTLAREIARRLKRSEVHEEISTILERIRTELSAPSPPPPPVEGPAHSRLLDLVRRRQARPGTEPD